ncbi:putative tricarboxylic transport membrane protein [Geosporobacter subterraneus DSM 17957]|uniref:Putative tricarboxylic transport membrane protein n=1 Tax=Geosporobacter subterraneus DSM 17957 TaxID=1121919 RepID=A0A1M6EQT8_9FIRM|nr:tripartite tricarboxylate transporter permease [Geosporobacter subterraneus]SHI87679.1 putative tricarboxylic transport membrane protein [Geosporobacter subterraneus DSM 17957]
MRFDLLMQGFANVLQLNVLLMVVLGVTGGIMVGSLPGLTATMGVALLVPFTFGLPINQSMAMLLGIFCGAIYGGSISAILIRTPGTPAAAATLLDGYPLSERGEAGRALSMSVFASFIGGFSGALIMTFLSPQISKVALKFGPPEYFALAIFGLSIIISVSGNSILKGVMAGIFGLTLSTIGLDPISGYPRFTFGQMDLFEGPAFIPTLIGLFALSEIFKGVETILTREKVDNKITQLLPTLADIKKCWKVILKSSILGTFIGSIPGAGSDIAAFVGYSEAKRTSKYPEKFGTGVIEGVAAAESANNACTGGAMIPLLSLGVPGDAVTAVLLGAFVIQGLRPGPLLYRDHMDVVYSVFAAMMVANIVMFIIGALGVKFFSKVITVDRNILIPVIFLLSIVGSYAMRNSIFDVWVAILFGILGYFMQRYDFPASPILLALILGPMAESNLRRALVISKGDISILFTRPISVILLGLAVVSLISSFVKQKRVEKRLAQEESEAAFK